MKKIISITILLIFVTNGTLAHAISLIPNGKMTKMQLISDLIKKSSLILEGQVVSLSSRYAERPLFLPKGRRLIVTDIEVQVSRPLKGAIVDRKLTVSILGGCIPEDNLCLKTDLSPVFYEGEHVVLFLDEQRIGNWTLTDSIYGKQFLSTDGKMVPLGITIDEMRSYIEDPKL